MEIIQTKYNGYSFRSRTEARWAVFFDEAGFSYEYEPEGFLINVDGIQIPYLPDFYINDFELYLEIKRKGFEKSKEYDEEMWKLLHFEHEIALIAGPPLVGIQMKYPCWIPDYSTGRMTDEWEIRESFFSNSGEWFLNWSNDDSLYESLFGDAVLKSKSARFEYGETPTRST